MTRTLKRWRPLDAQIAEARQRLLVAETTPSAYSHAEVEAMESELDDLLEDRTTTKRPIVVLVLVVLVGLVALGLATGVVSIGICDPSPAPDSVWPPC